MLKMICCIAADILALIYLIWPFDIVPDIMPVVGFMDSLFSAAKIARLSSNVPPCTLLDGEFWHSQNIAAAITTAIRGGSERRVCINANIAY